MRCGTRAVAAGGLDDRTIAPPIQNQRKGKRKIEKTKIKEL